MNVWVWVRDYFLPADVYAHPDPEEWAVLSNPEDSLHGLVVDIASYCLLHGAETCDLLMEIEQIDLIGSLVTMEIEVLYV